MRCERARRGRLLLMGSLIALGMVACEEMPEPTKIRDAQDAGDAKDAGSDERNGDDMSPDDLASDDTGSMEAEDMPVRVDLSPDLHDSRRELDVTRMRQGKDSGSGLQVSMQAFAPDRLAKRGQADTFAATLTFEPGAHDITVWRDDGERGSVAGVDRPPGFEIELTRRASDGALIPGARGFVGRDSTDAWWAMVGVGRTWKEEGDGGWSRASLPLTLVEPFATCSFHGMVTWLYDAERGLSGEAYYQISQETCVYFKADLWGWFEVSSAPLELTRSGVIEQRFGEEESARIEVRPIERLESLGIEPDVFFRERFPQHLTTYGVVWEGVHYRGECATRRGAHPLCEEMVLPSYSTSKSAVASFAYLALLMDRGDVGERTLGDTLDDVPVGWQDVTLERLLDMRSGHYDSPLYRADEEGARMTSFFLEHADEDKRQAALAFPLQPGVPGWVYHTSDTFLAVSLMQQVLGEDLFGWVVARIFEPLNLSLVARSAHLRTLPDASTGRSQHFGGYGAFWLPGDVALCSQALHDHAVGSRQDLFESTALRQVMQRDASPSGVLAAPGLRYHRGFWGLEVDETMGFPCRRVIPFMSGFGGITVALLPNGVTYYAFRDDATFEWLAAAVELSKLGEFCASTL